MKKALIIHGAYGNPNQNWFPWLKQQLEAQQYKVEVPQFPTPENQTLQHWLEVIAPYLDKLDAHSIIIGHSIGATFILRLLEQVSQPIAVAALVSGFISDLPDSTLNQINHTFYDQPFNWDAIRANARRILLFHSPDDPFVPMDKSEQVARQIHRSIISIPKAGHFNTASGYTQFPQLLEEILRHPK